MSEANWFWEQQGNILDRFDLYLDGDYRPWVDEAPADNFYLVHAVSGDNAQGAGFAQVVNVRYHFRDSLCADLAESFPGFGLNGWKFDRNTSTFYRTPTVTNSHSPGYVVNGTYQRMKFEGFVGSIYETERCPHILGLVTKEHYYDKPTLETMRKALWNLRSKIETESWLNDESGLVEVMMPHIGCGLDKLKWEDVREIIFDELHELGEAGKLRVVAMEPKKQLIRF